MKSPVFIVFRRLFRLRKGAFFWAFFLFFFGFGFWLFGWFLGFFLGVYFATNIWAVFLEARL